MDETVMTPTKLKTASDYKTAIQRMFAEMELLEAQMERDHAESERLKMETQVIKARTEANLIRLREQMNNLSGTA